MKLPLNWLRDYIKIEKSSKEIADVFTKIGYMLDEPIINEVLSLEVRQNRADCLSILGLARELSAAMQVTYQEPKLSDVLPSSKVNSYLGIECPEKLNRFCALHIKTKVGESSKFIKGRLESVGIPSINNIVDITNFVMMELGQPMHAFDSKKIDGKNLVVRWAKEKEEFETLLGSEINLDSEDLVIADKSKIVGLAGIIGGKNSNCEISSTDILIEAANYDQTSIRKSSRKHNIRTEASTRLEKFLSPILPEMAIKRFLQILTDEKIPFEILGYENFSNFPKTLVIPFQILQVKRLGGIILAKEEILKILMSLNIKYQEIKEGNLELETPYYRTDLTMEEDIVEEILRIYGYEKIPSLPINIAPPQQETVSAEYILEDKIRDIMVKMGFDEHITDPLIKKAGLDCEIVLENCLNEDKNALRTQVTQTLQPVLDNYKKHKIKDRKNFEVGKIYSSFRKLEATYEEIRVVTALCGEEILFEELKGYTEQLLALLDISGVEFAPIKDGADIIQRGNLLGKISRHSFTFYITALVKAKKTPTQYVETEIPNYMYEDITTELSKKVFIGETIDKIKSSSDKVAKVELIGIFEKGNSKAVTLRVFYKGGKYSSS